VRFEAGVAVQSQVGPHIYKRRFRVTNIMEDRDSDVFVDHYHYTGVLPAMHRQTLYPPPLHPNPLLVPTPLYLGYMEGALANTIQCPGDILLPLLGRGGGRGHDDQSEVSPKVIYGEPLACRMAGCAAAQRDRSHPEAAAHLGQQCLHPQGGAEAPHHPLQLR